MSLKHALLLIFIGLGEFINGRIVDEYCVDTALGRLEGQDPLKFSPGTPVELLIRPDDIQHQEGANITGVIVSKWFRGSHYLYHVKLENGEIVPCITACHHDHDVNETLDLKVEFDHLVVFPSCDPENEVCELQEADVVPA